MANRTTGGAGRGDRDDLGTGGRGGADRGTGDVGGGGRDIGGPEDLDRDLDEDIEDIHTPGGRRDDIGRSRSNR